MTVITDRCGQLERPPIVYSIFAVNYPKELSVDTSVAKIQSILKSEYPFYHSVQSQSFEFSSDNTGQQTISTKTDTDHHFYNSDQTRGFIFGKERFVYHSTEYIKFENFKEWINLSLKTVCEELKIEYFTGFGIRHIDVISSNSISELKKLINIDSHPYEFDLDDKVNVLYSQQSQTISSDFGHANIKSHWLTKEEKLPCLPPELIEGARFLKFKEFERNPPFFVLDLDYNHHLNINHAVKIDLSNLFQKLQEMHDFLSKRFLDVVSEDGIRSFK